MISRKEIRRFISIIMIAVVLSVTGMGYGNASAATQQVGKGLYVKSGVTIEINGKSVKFTDPILNKDGSLLLPMRAFYEAIGATVKWGQTSKVASASRNGKLVELTIDSSVAKVNGKNVTVSVPPLLYKYRTYVPLRFVSENFDGQVIWNQPKQKVEITLDKPAEEEPAPLPPVDPYVLHINNKRVMMSDPVIVKLGRTYIPANYFYENIENASENWLTDQQLELQIAGLNFVFTNGSNIVVINEEPIMMSEIPFIQSGKMYVPVHFIVNALGGNLRNMPEKSEMYIYLTDLMFHGEFIEKSSGPTSLPVLVPNARLEGTRDLLISDNPETLTSNLISSSTATLAQYDIQSASSMKEHRVFGWHYNQLGKTSMIGITIQNTSANNSIEVTNSKGYAKTSGNSWINYDIGLPIADAVLSEKLKNSDSTGIVIPPGETKTIETFELYPGYTLGFIQDIDVRSVNGANSSYTIRTVLAQNKEDLTSIHSEQVSIDKFAAHPRGVWPQSSITADLPTYITGSPEVGYNLSNGKTDHFLTEQNSLSKINGSVGNPGHFGLTYKVNIPILNPSGEEKVVKLKLAGRGGLYSGAIKMNGKVHLIPTLKPSTEYVELSEYRISGQSETISLEIMHAGGANMPAAIYVETVN